jgi:histone H3/H4
MLTRASRELFRRSADERFTSLDAMARHCRRDRESSRDLWIPPSLLLPEPSGPSLGLGLGPEGNFSLNDWSFTQLCQLARVSKETVNRLSSETAADVFRETLPGGKKPLQLYARDNALRSVHGVSYTRLHNADLLDMLMQSAGDFTPPQTAMGGGTGLYAGEQDLFCFLIDPTGWVEINGEAFAPGGFLWNSEVGKRSLGIETFWFQAVCQNHIVWDAVDVATFTRKHTANVHESLAEIQRLLSELVSIRNERRDSFARIIKQAMETKLGADAEEVLATLAKNRIPRTAAKKALEIAERNGRFTIFALVDALTRLSGEIVNAGDRTDADKKAGALLALVA